jgi:choline kinase
MQLIYLAAGRGKRLGQKYSSKPKCFVKLNNKKIIDYNKNFFSKFNKVILITGYKSEEIEKKFQKNKKIFIIYNKDYMKTNMVYSMFLARDYIKEDVVV